MIMPAGAVPFPFGKCRVCQDRATGVHYGVATCEGCKGFFKRSTLRGDKYKCFFGGSCELGPQNRNRCKSCRFRKCLENGMAIDAVKMGRIPKLEKERALAQQKREQDDMGTFDNCVSSTTLPNASADIGPKSLVLVEQVQSNNTENFQAPHKQSLVQDVREKREMSSCNAIHQEEQSVSAMEYEANYVPSRDFSNHSRFKEESGICSFSGSDANVCMEDYSGVKDFVKPWKNFSYGNPQHTISDTLPPQSSSSNKMCEKWVSSNSYHRSHQLTHMEIQHDNMNKVLQSLKHESQTRDLDVCNVESSIEDIHKKSQKENPYCLKNKRCSYLDQNSMDYQEHISRERLGMYSRHEEASNNKICSWRDSESYSQSLSASGANSSTYPEPEVVNPCSDRTQKDKGNQQETDDQNKGSSSQSTLNDNSVMTMLIDNYMTVNSTETKRSDQCNTNQGPSGTSGFVPTVPRKKDVVSQWMKYEYGEPRLEPEFSVEKKPSNLNKESHNQPSALPETFTDCQKRDAESNHNEENLWENYNFLKTIVPDPIFGNLPLHVRTVETMKKLGEEGVLEQLVEFPIDMIVTTANKLRNPIAINRHGSIMEEEGGLLVSETIVRLKEVAKILLKPLWQKRFYVRGYLSNKIKVKFTTNNPEEIKETWASLMSSVNHYNQLIIGFCKNVPGFGKLEGSLKEYLVERVYFDIWLLNSAEFMFEGVSFQVMPNGWFYSKETMIYILKEERVRELFSVSEDMNSIHLTDLELTLLCVIQLTSPDNIPEEKCFNLEPLRVLNIHYLDILANVVAQNYGMKCNMRLSKIFQFLPSLTRLATKLRKQVNSYEVMDLPNEEKLETIFQESDIM